MASSPGNLLSRSHDTPEIQGVSEPRHEVSPSAHEVNREIRATEEEVRRLVAEVARRGRVEATLRESIRDLRRIEAELRRSQRETERLAKITGAIADAVTPEQISEAIVDEAASTVGASRAGLWTLSGRALELVRSVGYSEDSKRAFSSLSLDSPETPVVTAFRDGLPVWIDSPAELIGRYPGLAGHVTSGKRHQVGCLPLFVQGAVFGVLAFTFDDTPPLDTDGKRFLHLVARHSAQALERLRLLEVDQLARARTDLLYKLAAQVIKSHGIDEVLEGALNALEEALHANRSAVRLFDAEGVMRFMAFRGLSNEYCRAVEGHSPWTRSGSAPEPILVSDVERDERSASLLPALRAEHIRALAVFPLVADGALLGKLMVYFDAPRELTCHEVDMVHAIANHVASAVARFAALKELEETVRFNQVFTAILGHDLRNPLAAIMSSAYVAGRRDTEGKLAKPISRIVKSGTRMARMIDQLLDFTRVRVGAGIPLKPRSVDLAALLETTIEELEGANPEISVQFETEGDVHGFWDGDRLYQVFSNLLGNAMDHGIPAEGVRVRVDAPTPNRVRVSVHNGGAIPRDLLPRIFDPMVEAGLRRERSSGLGLGLFISREITRAHGGSIEVHSTEADGTTFVVSLPRGAEELACP